jgi:hypothetical protein
MRFRLSARGVLLLRVVLAAGILHAGTPADASPPPGNRIHLFVETVRVGSGGTETIAADEAELMIGQAAVLAKEVTLSGAGKGGSRASEKVSFRTEIRVAGVAESRLAFNLSSRTHVLAATGGITIPRSDTTKRQPGDAAAGASYLFPVYESENLRQKIALNIRWSAVEETSPGAAGLTPIPFTFRLYELSDSGTILLEESDLSAGVGWSASANFNRTLPLSDAKDGGKRVRQESMEVTLSPLFLSGGSLNLDLEASGEVVTRDAGGDSAHPVAHRGNYTLSSGQPIEIELPIQADPDRDEGWSRVNYRLEIVASI